RGTLQVYREQADTLASFDQTRDSFFASKGWEPDSAMARSYERRLSQPEATGWFGLANVYATLMAAATVALVGWMLLGIRAAGEHDSEVTGGWAGLLVAGAASAAWGLYLSGSRAGYLALAVAAATLAGVAWLARRARRARRTRRAPRASESPFARLAGLLPIALGAGVVGIIAVQPILADHAFDLSLRFRGFYMWGAAGVFVEHALLGVGPGGFQDAYMLAKPALAPENVASPHSIVFDLLATLGIGGLAWAAMWIVFALGVGRRLSRPSSDKSCTTQWRERRVDFLCVLALTAIPTLADAWFEAAATTPDRVIARFVGLAGWFGVAAASVALMRRNPAWIACAAAGAVAMIVHAQMDVAPVTPGAVGWILVLMGAIAASDTKGGERGRVGGVFAGLLAAGVAAFIAVTAWSPTAVFERRLTDAANELEPLTSIQTRIDALRAGLPAVRGDSIERLWEDLGRMLGIPTPRTPEEIMQAHDMLFLRTTSNALGPLGEAGRIYPANVRIAAARARLRLLRAGVLFRAGSDGDTDLAAGLWAVESCAALRPSSAAAWAAVAVTTQRAYQIDPQQHRARMDQAIAALERAAALDPHGVRIPVRLHDAYEEIGDMESAKAWAVRALDLNRQLALDPVIQLSDRNRQRLEQTANRP
ncbi:MAG: O-antigen ligase family protein, partial [Planctomycetes bacterium]|nr:O-antigen ligase family protein [Planctomycetota bacterium]